jgi:hypothetical protein
VYKDATNFSAAHTQQLVAMLASVKGARASTALAQRAIFDVSPDVREAAIASLKDRPSKEYRPVLLDGMRYPWTAVAEHATEALVALKDRDAAPSLVSLLDLPDPAAPVHDKGDKWVVTEVVRVNHLRNCLMCHAPSFIGDEPIRALVPEKGKPLAESYYERREGNFVRADVVYLKQDFSMTLPVSGAQPWLMLQRFDYLTRKRELSKKEIDKLALDDKDRSVGENLHRSATLWALRQLTGKDAGPRSEDWSRELQAATPNKRP